MTAAAPPLLRTVTFGDVEAGVWGACWELGELFTALASAGGAEGFPDARLEGSSMDGTWRLMVGGAELELLPVAEPVRAGPTEGPEVVEQLCRVNGVFELGGIDVELRCLGRRCTRAREIQPELDSIRDVSAWFDGEQGLTLTAQRPRPARGQDRDLISAALLGEPDPVSMFDPRLSTTYDGDGAPVRAGLELWVGAEEDDQLPRRAAGEAVGGGITGRAGAYAVRAVPFRWHSRGRDGSGVYLLARAA